MIIKEDTPAVFTGRPLSSFPPPNALPSSADASSLSRSLPDTPTESIPSYHLPSFPAPAHLAPLGPTSWRSGPPPRYKFRQRPLRYLPLALSLALAAVVLGTAVNFQVDAILLIATTHIKPRLFEVFRQIVAPTHMLLGTSIFTILVLPLHHLLPVPSARLSFRTATHRHRALVVARLLVPTINAVLYIIAGSWFLSIALDRQVDKDPHDSQSPIGNGQAVERDPRWPDEGAFWEPWFFADPNVKMVVFSTLFAGLASGVYLANAIPGNFVHRMFTGTPPKRLGRWEAACQRWWRVHVVGRSAAAGDAEAQADAEDAEMERILEFDPATDIRDRAASHGLDDQTADRGARFRIGGGGSGRTGALHI